MLCKDGGLNEKLGICTLLHLVGFLLTLNFDARNHEFQIRATDVSPFKETREILELIACAEFLSSFTTKRVSGSSKSHCPFTKVPWTHRRDKKLHWLELCVSRKVCAVL